MKKIKFAAYVRKSTEGAERQVLSKAAQKDKIEEFFPNLDIVWFDESKSAFKPYQRPEFAKMFELIQKGDIQGIVAWHPDRLSRNEVDASSITWAIRQGLIQDIKFASYNFDNSPEGIMMLQMTMSQSQYQSAKLSKDVKRGIGKKLMIGQLAGRAPEGYVNNKADRTIEADPDRFPILQKAFQMYLSNEFTIPEIKRMIDESGYLTIRRRVVGGNQISRSTIYKMLSNPRYCGKIPNPMYPDDLDMMYDADFPSMISVDEFLKIQSMLGTRGRTRYVTKKHFDLKGIFKCGECGCSITAERKTKALKNGSINYHVYYHCTHKRKCSQKSINETDLNDKVDELLQIYEIPSELYEWGKKALSLIAKSDEQVRSSSLNLRNGSKEELNDKLERILDMFTDNKLTEDEYLNQKAKICNKIKQLEVQQSESEDNARNWHEAVGLALDRLHNASETFKGAKDSMRKDIIHAIGYNPTIINKEVVITPYKWIIPIAEALPHMKYDLDEVITDNDLAAQSVKSNKKDPNESLLSSWQGY